MVPLPRTSFVLALAFALSFALALAGCTGNESPVEDDADGDLLSDAEETTPRVIEVTTLSGVEKRDVTSDPTKADTDGDGLSDVDEVQRGTDPRDVDTDDDGLLDGDDAHPEDQETIDAWRRQGVVDVNGTFLGELDACPSPGPQLKATHASSDLPIPDGLLDGEELRGWTVTVRANTYHVTSNPCLPDTDTDGLADDGEKLAGSDPRRADTDGDGTIDWGDVDPTADLYLRFDALEVAGPNGTIHLLFSTATATATLTTPGDGAGLLNIPDGRGAQINSTKVGLTLQAADAAGEPVNLTADGYAATLFFDVVQGTVEGAEVDGDRLRFAGTDGSMSFRWSLERR